MRALVSLSILAAAASAHADALRFGHTSVAFTTQPLTAQTQGVTAFAMGWRKCDPGNSQFTTRTPLLAWDVTEQMELRIRLEDEHGNRATVGGVVLLPNGSYVCAGDKKEFWLRNWPQGNYRLFLLGSARDVSAIVRFDNPALEKQQLTTAVANLPALALGGATNPQFQTVNATFAVDSENAGATCAKAGQRVMPLASLRVERAGRWYVGIDPPGDRELFVVTADHRCVDPRNAPELAAGTHTLWTIVQPNVTPPSFALEIDDRGAALAFGDATKRPVGALDYPLVIDGKVRSSERWSARGAGCNAARTPDFYLVTDKPLAKVTVSLLWSHTKQRMHLYGPVERANASAAPICSKTEHTFDTLDGTYAVWVGDAPAGSTYHVYLHRDGTKLDPLTTLVDPPADLTIPDRALKNHYPYFQGKTLDEWTKIFTTAPGQLFVYTRNEIDLGDQKLLAGEPLLVQSAKGDVAVAYRDDGVVVRVDTRSLTKDKPAAINLPTIARSPKLDDIADAIKAADPEDAKPIADYRALEAKLKDPKKLDGAKAKLLAALDTTRRHRYKQHLIAVRKRFGL
jgi:hypothetical protein